MKYFLIDQEVRDGDNEYSDRFLVEAQSLKELDRKMGKLLVEYWNARKDEWNKKERYLDLFDRIIKVDRIEELNQEEFEAGKRFFWVYNKDF